MVDGLNQIGRLPCRVVYKDTVKTADDIAKVIKDIEFVHINKDSDPARLEQDLMLADMAWKLKG